MSSRPDTSPFDPADEQACISAAFTLPDANGAFDRETEALARRLSTSRPAVVLAFAPKAAGTFFRTAAVIAADGQLIRGVHAQGERDAQFYLPTFLAYYLGKLTPHTMVTHVHMQALAANQKFIEAFDLKPVIMLRPIPDMLASYQDMLEQDPAALAEGLNGRIPPAFASWDRAQRADFLIDMLGPWYASYFATWLAYAAQAPGRVLTLTYDAFVADPAAALHSALAHAGIRRPLELCQAAVARSWSERETMRFNRGVAGRGRDYFSSEQFGRLTRMLAYYGLAGAAGLLGA